MSKKAFVPDTEEEKVLIGEVVGCKLLNVRAEPGLNADILGTLKEGDTVKIVFESPYESWVEIESDGDTRRYCMAKYISIQQDEEK